jgi:hypothetical protein
MALFDFLKPRLTPEAVYQLCLKEQPSPPEWNGPETITWGVIREITFDIESSMARAILLVPRGDKCVVVPSNSYKKFVKIGRVWRVGAEPSFGLRFSAMGASKLVHGTLSLEAGDVLQVGLHKDSLLPEPEFPRTPDGWAANMVAKFLPHGGYQMGQQYFFKGPWSD